MKYTVYLFIPALILAFSSCAVLDEKNRPVTAALDELAPESPVVQAALSPLAVPVGILTLAIDGVLIQPIRSLPKALYDATWVFRGIESTGIGEIIVFPMRLITMPFIFVISELIRITIPSDLHDDNL